MNRATAVNLKSIDTTGVNVSYAYSTTKLDTSSEITGETTYTLQKLENYGDEVYVYVIVSPTETSIPTTFTASIVWYYGIPQELKVIDNVTNSVISSQTIVSGQYIDSKILTEPTAPDGYYFDAWFTDKEYTQLIESEVRAGSKVYARYHNFPLNSDCMTYSDGSYSVTSDPLITNLIVPTIYNDGTNGEAYVTGIGDYAFGGDYVLESLSVPSTLSSIGENSFTANILKSIDLSKCKNLTIGDYAFYECYGLATIIWPKNMTSIGDGAFYECDSLTSVNLSGCTGLTSIGNNAFEDCTALTSITIPSSVTSIGDLAFNLCSSLTSVDLSQCTSLTTIGEYAFYDCSSLTSIAIPSSITSIGSNAFFGCYALAEVYNLSRLSITTGSTSNGSVGYYAKVIHTNATIPSRIQIIDNMQYYVYENDFIALAPSVVRTNLTKVTLDSRTTEINAYAFYGCSKLTSITFEDTSTWYYTSSSSYTSGTQIDVTNASTNATYFKTTYYDKYWYKV